MTPEEEARQIIDGKLAAVRWVVQDKGDIDLTAGIGVAVREFSLKAGHGEADYLLYADQGLARFKGIALPIAPVAEQAEIVAQAEERLTQCQAAEKAVADGIARADRLRHSILKRAFEGRLVPVLGERP